MVRYELRDIITAYPGEPGDFQPDLPPGTRVVEEDLDYNAPPGPVNVPRAMAGAFARQAAKDARSAAQGFVDFIRGGDARLPQDDADDLAGHDDQAGHLVLRVVGRGVGLRERLVGQGGVMAQPLPQFLGDVRGQR
jgi:hypothetical protein